MPACAGDGPAPRYGHSAVVVDFKCARSGGGGGGGGGGCVCVCVCGGGTRPSHAGFTCSVAEATEVLCLTTVGAWMSRCGVCRAQQQQQQVWSTTCACLPALAMGQDELDHGAAGTTQCAWRCSWCALIAFERLRGVDVDVRALSVGHKMVVFGGYDGKAAFADLWAYDIG